MALRIDIKGHITDLQAKLSEAKGRLSRFASSVKSRLMGIGGALAGAFAITRIISGLNRLKDEMDEIGKSAKAIGVSAETFQEMKFAAKLAGVEMSKLKMSMGALGAFMLQAANGGKIQSAVLKRLSLDYDALSKMKPEEQFKLITKALDGVSNATERVGLARSVFGRSGMDLLLVAREYEKSVQAIRAGGGIISNEEIAKAEELNDQIATMATRMKAVIANTGFFSGINDFLKVGFVKSDHLVREAYGKPITKAMVDAAKKGRQEAGKDIKAIFDEGKKKNTAAKSVIADQVIADQFRRIGATSFGNQFSNQENKIDELNKSMTIVAEATNSINRKTPEVNQGGKF